MIVTDERELRIICRSISADAMGTVFSCLEAEIRLHPTAVGLAAPQIGIPLRAFVYWGTSGELYDKTRTLIRVANPQVLGLDEPFIDSKEGCLSIPKVFCLMKRYNQVHVKDDINGTYVLTGDESNVFQHELDHLDGLLITDNGIRIPDYIGRNDKCYCGSNKKYKRCHGM